MIDVIGLFMLTGSYPGSVPSATLRRQLRGPVDEQLSMGGSISGGS